MHIVCFDQILPDYYFFFPLPFLVGFKCVSSGSFHMCTPTFSFPHHLFLGTLGQFRSLTIVMHQWPLEYRYWFYTWLNTHKVSAGSLRDSILHLLRGLHCTFIMVVLLYVLPTQGQGSPSSTSLPALAVFHLSEISRSDSLFPDIHIIYYFILFGLTALRRPAIVMWSCISLLISDVESFQLSLHLYFLFWEKSIPVTFQ
jgi:hypothetical protein